MAFQRVDKENPKIVPKEKLEGFKWNCLADDTKEYLQLEYDDLAILWNSLYVDQTYPIRIEDIPNVVKALWAAYAESERRNLENE